MPGLLILLAAVVVVGTLALAAALRRARAEVGPTVDAFTAFRAALDPEVLALRAEAHTTGTRLDAGRGSEPTER
jgi:O-acetylhomoserine/O-acetylserine sulfhydrylase-like pyridoxal-dependent enzyme